MHACVRPTAIAVDEMAQQTSAKSRQKKTPPAGKPAARSVKSAGGSAAKAATPPASKAAPAKGKPSSSLALPRSATSKSKTAPIATAAEIHALRTANASLTAELEAAKLKIAILEAARQEAINRIDWVLDSLQSLAAEKLKG